MPEPETIDWDLLLRRIKTGKCTPFIGAGACYGSLPLGSDVATTWARQYGYPLRDDNDLARVAQFLAVKRHDAQFPKDLLVEQYFDNTPSPDFSDTGQVHRVLAALPFPIYVTTNYDDFMVAALKTCCNPPKRPLRELCRWNPLLRDYPSVFDQRTSTRDVTDRLVPFASLDESAPYEPTIDRPVVFHLHGHYKATESLVLTEDDYLDFLINISRNDAIIPARIQRAFSATSLLFVGYSLGDWDFRVLFRSLTSFIGRSQVKVHVSVQIVPSTAADSEEQTGRVREYLSQYFGHQAIQVYWGSCTEFAIELRDRWSSFSYGR